MSSSIPPSPVSITPSTSYATSVAKSMPGEHRIEVRNMVYNDSTGLRGDIGVDGTFYNFTGNGASPTLAAVTAAAAAAAATPAPAPAAAATAAAAAATPAAEPKNSSGWFSFLGKNKATTGGGKTMRKASCPTTRKTAKNKFSDLMSALMIEEL